MTLTPADLDTWEQYLVSNLKAPKGTELIRLARIGLDAQQTLLNAEPEDLFEALDRFLDRWA